MTARSFWRGVWADDRHGFAFVLGMCVFWFGPLLFGAIAIMVPGTIWTMLGGAVMAFVGWVLAWVVMIGRARRAAPGGDVDLTPTRPMLLPAALMVGGVVVCLLSF